MLVSEITQERERDTERGPVIAELKKSIADYYKPININADQYDAAIQIAYDTCRRIGAGKWLNEFSEIKEHDTSLRVMLGGNLDGSYITSELAEANKAFAYGLYAYLEKVEKTDMAEAEKVTFARNIYKALLSTSPCVVSYLGGTVQQIEIMAFAERSELGRQLTKSIKGDIIYECSFDQNVDATLSDGYKEQPSTVAQLAYVRTLEQLASEAVYSGYADHFVNTTRVFFRHVAQDPLSHPLVGIIANQADAAVGRECQGEDIFYDEYEANLEKIQSIQESRQIEPVDQQEDLHSAFPNLPSNRQGRLVARDAVASYNSNVVEAVYTSDGRLMSLVRPEENGSLTREDSDLLRVMYQPAVRTKLEDQFGVKLVDINFDAQVKLLHFMATADKEVYERLSRELHRTRQPPELAGAFLATEFGDEFGYVLLDVAELIPDEQLTELLEKVQRIRQYGARFAEQFNGFDNRIVSEIKRVIGERVTEALYVAKGLAKSGNDEISAKVLGHRITVKDISEINDALDLISLGLERIAEADASRAVAIGYDEENRSAWNLGAEGDVLLQIKPRGERRGNFVHGSEHSEEAQINYSVDTITEAGDYVPIDIGNYRRRYALSIRLDLEGIIRDVNGGKIGFDATRERLTAALDIGSLRGAPDNPNVRAARIISLGNKLRKRDLGQGRSQGYHTSLPEEYGYSLKFAGLAEFMRAKYRGRSLGRGAVAAALGRSTRSSSASQLEKAAA